MQTNHRFVPIHTPPPPINKIQQAHCTLGTRKKFGNDTCCSKSFILTQGRLYMKKKVLSTTKNVCSHLLCFSVTHTPWHTYTFQDRTTQKGRNTKDFQCSCFTFYHFFFSFSETSVSSYPPRQAWLHDHNHKSGCLRTNTTRISKDKAYGCHDFMGKRKYTLIQLWGFTYQDIIKLIGCSLQIPPCKHVWHTNKMEKLCEKRHTPMTEQPVGPHLAVIQRKLFQTSCGPLTLQTYVHVLFYRKEAFLFDLFFPNYPVMNFNLFTCKLRPIEFEMAHSGFSAIFLIIALFAGVSTTGKIKIISNLKYFPWWLIYLCAMIDSLFENDL